MTRIYKSIHELFDHRDALIEENEMLRNALWEIDGALCNYLNQVGDSFEPVDQWNEFCWKSFDRLAKAYNDWYEKDNEFLTKMIDEEWRKRHGKEVS